MPGAPLDAARLADERAALKRLAELVARGPQPHMVLAAIAAEACDLCVVDFTAVLRVEADGPLRIVALHHAPAELAVGNPWPLTGGDIVDGVVRSGRAARADSCAGLVDPDADYARRLGMEAAAAAPVLIDGQVWGVIAAVSSSPGDAAGLEARLAAFVELATPAIAAVETSAGLQGLADEQAALWRVAELVAGGGSQRKVLDAVAEEACRLLGGHFTALLRYEPQEPAVLVAMAGPDAVKQAMHVGMPLTMDGDGIVQRVRRSAQAASFDSYCGVQGSNAATARALGLTSGVGAPILVEGRVWGAITVLGSGPPLPMSAEGRLAMFAKLVATAVANAQAREALERLADEQTALRHIAEQVARGVTPREVFAAVAAEASRLLDDQAMTLTRFDGERELVVVATSGGPAPVDTRIAFEAETLPDSVRRGDRPVRVDDYTRERDAQLAALFGLAAAVAVPISVEGAVWGMLTVTSDIQPLPAGTEHRLQQFAELVAAALASSQARAEVQALADEQAALRRVAELAAREAPADEVLATVTAEASLLAGVDFTTLLRFEPDGSTEIVALDGALGDISVGMRASGQGDGAVQRVWRTGRASRVDNLAEASGHWPQLAHGFGFAASAAVPIHLERRLWGVLVVVARSEPLPRAIETPLADFAELASTAIAAAQARRDLRMLADEQSALRHVAEVVAGGAALDGVFAAVAIEASKLLGNLATALLRYDSDDIAVAVAVCNSPAPLGLRIPAGSDTATGQVLRSGRPIRVDSFADTPLGDLATQLGVGAGVAVPISVEGLVWGALTTSTPDAPLPIGTEQRLAQFAELAAAAIANAENKAKLTASRARVIATADETRRRLQRDVHDGAQQRLVHTLMTLGLAKDAAAAGRPVVELIHEALQHAERANRDLRDLVRGILPASLTRGGLRAGLESLVSDISLPVDIRVTALRVPPATEITAYFIIAEALTNVVKHADATRATVEIELEDDGLSIRVSDDGSGGADPECGTGLTGLLDRIEASEGTLTITSPPTMGTTVHATLPLHGRAGS